LFIVFLPLFLAIVVDQVGLWKYVKRERILSVIDPDDCPGTWMTRVESSSHTYWAAFLICIGFAGLFQWVSVRLMPLLNGGGDYALDWGSLALARPELVGVLQQIAFTGAAYLYMGLCFYLFIAGLILLSSLVDDFVQIRTVLVHHRRIDLLRDVDDTGSRILRGIIRCTIVGLLIAICMKLQTLYLVTSAPNILDWLIADTHSLFMDFADPVDWDELKSPTNYTSLIVALLVSVVYLYGTIRIGESGTARNSAIRATSAVAFLDTVYLLLGSIPGFSLLLGVGLIVAAHGLFYPDFGFRRKEHRGQNYVS
jgi:hypothetical protein